MMKENKITLKTIAELTSEHFYIPAYQRGYRWTEMQVEDLLNDINEFSPKDISEFSNEKTWYCLQPVVVKQRENQWDVIDGQQRLTTIFLILHYLNKESNYSLTYETRKESEEFLKNELKAGSINDNNIDYYHISRAYDTISLWFKKNGLKNESFNDNFLNYTKVIWYETIDANSIDIFTRINIGKIPLTNAELIKALFLNSSNFKTEKNNNVRQKQLEIASEWDRIEYALQGDAFWYFINKEQNDLPTRIEFLFDLLTEKKTDSDDAYYTFRVFSRKFELRNASNKKSIIDATWKEVYTYYQALEEWFQDRELYHKIGFLITIGRTINSILKESKDKLKSEFKNWLDQEIKKVIETDLKTKDKQLELHELEYNQLAKVRRVLLWHNIQTMLQNNNETNLFPFDRYKKENWDVEHIHAIATEVHVTKQDQVQWLEKNFTKTEMHLNEEYNKLIEETIKNQLPIDDTKVFAELIEYVIGEEDNSLGNLCLLDSATNRSYKNDGFKEKRRKIIQREREGSFIPICTKNVFMKYYSADVNDLEIWNQNDRESYINAMTTTLNLS